MGNIDDNYIWPEYNDAIRLNNIMYYTYCFDVETNEWIFPFQEGTTAYYNLEQFPWTVTDLLIFASTDPQLSQTDRDFINAILSQQKTYAQAVAAGWITPE